MRLRSLYSFAPASALIAAFLLFALLWLARPAAHAQQPDALGSISGTVTNAQGEPLPNITVWPEPYTNAYQVRSVTTDAQGSYHLPSLYSGGYKLRFEDPSGAYAGAYYLNAFFANEAQTVIVNGNQVTGIDMPLAVGGSISVTIATQAPLTSTFVTSFLFRQNALQHWTLYRTQSWQLAQDLTRINGLPAGVYRLCADIQSGNFGDEGFECYDNIWPEAEWILPANAADIVVSPGNQTNITIAFGNFTPLEGYVRAPNGEPLSAIHVLAATQNQNTGYVTFTNANGYFRFGYLRDGAYRLVTNFANNQFFGKLNNYLPVFYPNTLYAKEAQYLPVSANSHYSLTITLQPEAQISGKISAPGYALYGGYGLSLYSQSADGSWQNGIPCQDPSLCPSYQNVAIDSLTGLYTVTQLLPGRYRLSASTSIGSDTGNFIHLAGFYGGPTLEEADDIVVGIGQSATNIDIILGEHDFDGSIGGIVTAKGVAQTGIDVGLFSPSQTGLPIVYTKTNSQGHYRFEGLNVGSAYMVAAHDPAGLYATTFYSESLDSYVNHIVTIPVTGSIDNINIALSPGGTIRGRVHVPTGTSPAGYKIAVQLFAGNTPFTNSFVDIFTDKDGNYKVTGLPPGDFLVSALSPAAFPNSAASLLRFHPGTADQYFALPVHVDAGQEQTTIDIYFTFAPSNFVPRLGAGAVGATATPTPQIPIE